MCFFFKNVSGYVCVFFFSSRRRHTRCSRDWSSDVCSSDLVRSTRGAEHQIWIMCQAEVRLFVPGPVGGRRQGSNPRSTKAQHSISQRRRPLMADAHADILLVEDSPSDI